jgi:sigma-E factor negative regulatory protein RseB
MKRFLLVCLLANPFPLAFAGEDSVDDPWLVLQKAAHAARELSYKGIFTYQSVGSTKSVEITHMKSSQGEYARIVVLDGLPREVLSQGTDAVIFYTRDGKVVIEKRRGKNMFPALLPANMDVIKLSYQVRLGGQERVGGRDGQIVFLDPRDRFRYSYKFWADREYGLLLKSLVSNERNEIIEQTAFNQLQLLDTQNMDWFQPNVDNKKSYVLEESTPAAPSAEVDSWTLAELPAGYRKIDQAKCKVPGKKTPVTHIIFSDGLASVSLFIEPLTKGIRPKTGRTAVGATNFYANVTNGHQIMVVGEAPEGTVAQIANAVSFKNNTLRKQNSND